MAATIVAAPEVAQYREDADSTRGHQLHGFAGIVNLSVGVTATAEADTDGLHRALSGAGYHSVETRSKSDAVFAVATEAWARGGRGTAALANDGEQFAAFIGRLDNAGELAFTLGQPLGSDAGALVTGAHRRWREEAPARLLGDFSYAVWDARERTLCLTRDIGGWHALYYLLRADRIVFADSLPVLLALAPDTRQLDPQVLADLLIDGLPPADRTIWRDVQAVAPASSVRIGRGSTVTRRYWQLPQTSLRYSRDDDYVEAARALLDEAVRCRLPATGSIGIALSGGLDSAGLAATIATLAPNTALLGFTGVPAPGAVLPQSPHQYNDETPYVRMLSERIPSLHSIEAWSAPNTEDAINEAIIHLAGMPLNNTLNAAWLSPAYEAATQHGVGTVLTGGFGNITLSYDGQSLLPALLDQGALIRFAVEYAALARSDTHRGWDIARAAFASSRRFSHYRRMRRDPTLWPRQRLQRAYLNSEFVESSAWLPYQLDAGAPIPTGGSDHREWHIGRSQRQRHLHGPLQRYWRAEFTPPLADQRLIEFCLSIPLQQYLRNGQTRHLARRVLSDRLPAAIVNNRLRGRQCPEAVQRVIAQAPRYQAELERHAESPLVRHCLDLAKMRAHLRHIGTATAAEINRVQHLHRALQHARFLDYLAQRGATL